jgi:hypothetical protein
MFSSAEIFYLIELMYLDGPLNDAIIIIEAKT